MKNKNMFEAFAEKRKSGRQAKKVEAKIERGDWDKIASLAKFAGCPAKAVADTLIETAVENAVEIYDIMKQQDPLFREWLDERNRS